VAVSFDPRIWKAEEMAFGFPYTLEPEENGWWLVRFPDVPEALTEGETREEAHSKGGAAHPPSVVNRREWSSCHSALARYGKAGRLRNNAVSRLVDDPAG